jgi:hypothetical protein
MSGWVAIEKAIVEKLERELTAASTVVYGRDIDIQTMAEYDGALPVVAVRFAGDELDASAKSQWRLRKRLSFAISVYVEDVLGGGGPERIEDVIDNIEETLIGWNPITDKLDETRAGLEYDSMEPPESDAGILACQINLGFYQYKTIR